MLRLDLTTEPAWLDMPRSVRIRVRPYSTVVTLMARADPEMSCIAPDASVPELATISARAVARSAILEWSGVGDLDGNPVDPNPEWVGRLLDQPDMFDAFVALYLQPAMDLDAEKNGLAPSPNGTTAAALNTAHPVRASARSARKR